MSTVITSGRALTLLCAACAALSLQAQTRAFDFENVPLGTLPEGVFADTWGAVGKGIYVYTTNLAGSEGSKQSLLINSQPGYRDSGLMVDFLPKGHRRGVVTFEFDYMREGAGRMQFEFHSESDPIFPLMWFEETRLHMKKGRGWHGKAMYPAFEPGVWYRFKMVYPLTPEDGKPTLTMTNLTTKDVVNETWEMENLGDSIYLKRPEGGAQFFFIKKGLESGNQSGSVNHEYLDNFKLTYQWK